VEQNPQPGRPKRGVRGGELSQRREEGERVDEPHGDAVDVLWREPGEAARGVKRDGCEEDTRRALAQTARPRPCSSVLRRSNTLR